MHRVVAHHGGAAEDEPRGEEPPDRWPAEGEEQQQHSESGEEEDQQPGAEAHASWLAHTGAPSRGRSIVVATLGISNSPTAASRAATEQTDQTVR